MTKFLVALESFVKDIMQKENLPQRALALLLACILWLYVSIQNNPITERSFDVHLGQLNMPTNMTVYNAPQKINVRVRGSRTVLNKKEASDILATVDFKNVTEGQQKLPVKVKTSIGDVIAVNPKEISVYVDTISDKTVSVLTRMVGSASEDLTLGNVNIKPQMVTIRGATHRLARVNKVVAPVDVTDKSGLFEAESELVAVSDDGYDIPNIVITPQRVLVSAVMVQQMLTVELPVELVTLGELPTGMELKEHKLEPTKVKISASPSKLKGMTVIKTKPLDISKLVESSTPIVELDLPEGAITDSRIVKAHMNVAKIDSEPQRDSVADGKLEINTGKEKKHEAKNK